MPKAQRLVESKIYLVKNNNPGPGAYEGNINQKEKKAAFISTARRNLDIRGCKIYLDANSYEIFR